MTKSLANTSVTRKPQVRFPANGGEGALRLTLRQQRILDQVIEAARQSPGTLRFLSKDDAIYTAQRHRGQIRWIVQSTFRQPIAEGICR